MIETHLPPCTPTTIFWYQVGTFTIGVLIGWAVRHFLGHDKKSFYVNLIRAIVILAWSAVTLKALIYNTEYPSMFLNIMFGSIAGGFNPAIGEYLIKLSTAFKK